MVLKIKFHIAITTISILLFAGTISAQDIHLSQYDANPLYLNPALTGLRLDENWDYRFNLNYREQRSNYLGRANKIIASGFDMPLNNKFSVGEFLVNHKTVNASLNTFNLMLSGAYKITHIDREGNDRHNISVGLQVGFLQRSFNHEDFTYDSQYSGSAAGGFDNNLPSGENFTQQSFFNFDVNMGVYYRYVNKYKKYSPFGGFSIYHLSQPDQSFTNINSTTPMRFNIHGGCSYKINEAYSLLPQVLYMNQGGANELNVGVLGYYKIPCTEYQPMLGVSWRTSSAVIVHLGLKHNAFNFRVSYDVNTYYLKQYGNRGLEFSIVYTPKKKAQVVDMVAVLVIQPDSTTLKQPNTLDSLPKKKTVIITDTIHKTFVIIDSIRSANRNVSDSTTIQKEKQNSSLSEPLIQNDTILIKKQKKIITIISYDTVHETIYLNKANETIKSVEIVKEPVTAQKETERSMISPTPVLPDPAKTEEPIGKKMPVPTHIDSTITESEKQRSLSSNTFPADSAIPKAPLKKDTLALSSKKIINYSPTQPIGLDSKEKNDSVKSNIPKSRTVTFDSPYDLYQQAKKAVIKDSVMEEKNAKNEPATTLVSETKFPVDSVFENISYRVQLGAFKENVLKETVNKLTDVGAIKINDLPEKGFTIFTIGDFSTHDDAISLKNEMIAKGFEDAFIIKIAPDLSKKPIKTASPNIQKIKEFTTPISPIVPTAPSVPVLPTFPSAPDSLFDIFHQKK